VTIPGITGSATQVRAISSGFHLEASIAPSTARAGEPFSITVKVTNDAGSVIQEINSFVTLQVQNASTRANGRGTLLTTQFQLLQGQRTVSETYTFVEPILIVARDDAGNAPATSNAITISPGAPGHDPPGQHAAVGRRQQARAAAREPGRRVRERGARRGDHDLPHLRATARWRRATVLSDAQGDVFADFLSARDPGHDMLLASWNALATTLDLETALVDPNAAGGTMTNYPNPFHPPLQGTTLAWKLDDNASVTLRIFTQNGGLVLRKTFDRATPGGAAGLNQWIWDGRNGQGDLVASGGYIALVEAQGTGETLHVVRRRLAVVR
jgi:hypothetical protein